jgi:outer membrane biosynthesis protein TonB
MPSGGRPATPAPAGAQVVQPRASTASLPDYPVQARQCRQQGQISVSLCIGEMGEASNVRLMGPEDYNTILNLSVQNWAARTRHTPGTVNGEPATFCGVTWVFTFQLAEGTVSQMPVRR